MDLDYIRSTSNANMSIYWFRLDDTTKSIFTFTVCPLSFVGTCGNLFTIIALLQSKTLRVEASTKFIISLALADFLFCSIYLPISIYGLITKERTQTYCYSHYFTYYGSCTASMCSLTAVTINRYISVCHNGIYTKIYSDFKVALMISIIWLFSFGYSIWASGKMGPNKEINICSVSDIDSLDSLNFFFAIYFVAPCIIIISSYAAIYFKVRKTRKELQECLGGKAESAFKVDIPILSFVVNRNKKHVDKLSAVKNRSIIWRQIQGTINFLLLFFRNFKHVYA